MSKRARQVVHQKAKTEVSTWNSLPRDILAFVTSFLDLRSRFMCIRVCGTWKRDLVNNPASWTDSADILVARPADRGLAHFTLAMHNGAFGYAGHAVRISASLETFAADLRRVAESFAGWRPKVMKLETPLPSTRALLERLDFSRLETLDLESVPCSMIILLQSVTRQAKHLRRLKMVWEHRNSMSFPPELVHCVSSLEGLTHLHIQFTTTYGEGVCALNASINKLVPASVRSLVLKGIAANGLGPMPQLESLSITRYGRADIHVEDEIQSVANVQHLSLSVEMSRLWLPHLHHMTHLRSLVVDVDDDLPWQHLIYLGHLVDLIVCLGRDVHGTIPLPESLVQVLPSLKLERFGLRNVMGQTQYLVEALFADRGAYRWNLATRNYMPSFAWFASPDLITKPWNVLDE